MGGSTVTLTSASLYIIKPSTPVSTWRAWPPPNALISEDAPAKNSTPNSQFLLVWQKKSVRMLKKVKVLHRSLCNMLPHPAEMDNTAIIVTSCPGHNLLSCRSCMRRLQRPASPQRTISTQSQQHLPWPVAHLAELLELEVVHGAKGLRNPTKPRAHNPCHPCIYFALGRPRTSLNLWNSRSCTAPEVCATHAPSSPNDVSAPMRNDPLPSSRRASASGPGSSICAPNSQGRVRVSFPFRVRNHTLPASICTSCSRLAAVSAQTKAHSLNLVYNGAWNLVPLHGAGLMGLRAAPCLCARKTL